MEIREKIVLKDKESANIPVKDLVATLSWKTSVDLDLYAFYRTKAGKDGKVYYGSKNALGGTINLDQDSGVGDTGGDNEENLRISNLNDLEHVVIAANIYNKSNANFAGYNSKVTIKSQGQEFEVPLTSEKGGSWAVIAHVDNSNPINATLKNLNLVQNSAPSVSEVTGQRPSGGGGGIFGRMFGG